MDGEKVNAGPAGRARDNVEDVNYVTSFFFLLRGRHLRVLQLVSPYGSQLPQILNLNLGTKCQISVDNYLERAVSSDGPP